MVFLQGEMLFQLSYHTARSPRSRPFLMKQPCILNKVLDVVGRDHERKFIKSIALDNIGNRAKWERLVVYLKGELKIREAWILNEKVRKANLETSDKSKTNDTKKESKDQVVHLGKSGPPVAIWLHQISSHQSEKCPT